MANVMVNIPMQGSASSLNVAVATSIILSEIGRQRIS
jgi:tRNA G18 (ribose-2'-O)-methylase SpoU